MRTFTKITLAALLIITTLSLAGCGGDKFSGKWINTGAEMGEGYRAKELVIEKNGNNYLIKENVGGYQENRKIINQKEYNHSVMANPFSNNPPAKVIPICDYTFAWTMGTAKQETGIEKNGILTINQTLGLDSITYVEKDDTLLWNKVIFKKEKNDDIEKFKQSEQKRIPEMIKQRDRTVKINKMDFVDVKSK